MGHFCSIPSVNPMYGNQTAVELLGGNVRLRLHGNVVRIEADKTSFGKLLEHGDEIVKTLKGLGFVYITMDLEGFRSGSMDVGLDK